MKFKKSADFESPPIETQRDKLRSQNAKKHKKKRKKNYTLHYIILSVFLIITVVVLSRTVFFNVSHITITENNIFDDKTLPSFIGVKDGDNLFKIKSKEIEGKLLKESILLSDVIVQKKLPSTLHIELVFAKPVVAYNYGRQYYYFSEQNRCISKSKEKTHEVVAFWGVNLNKIKEGEYLKNNEKEEYINSLLEEFSKVELEGITAVDLSDLANIKLYYEDRIEIKLGNLTELNYKLTFAKRIIDGEIEKDELGILDVQIKGKGYFRNTNEINMPS